VKRTTAGAEPQIVDPAEHFHGAHDESDGSDRRVLVSVDETGEPVTTLREVGVVLGNECPV
jgi:hypothetical protein